MEQEVLTEEDHDLLKICVKNYLKRQTKKTDKILYEEDYFTDAYYGLLSARKLYNPTKGEWGSYAFFRIQGAIKDGVRKDLNRKGIKRSNPDGIQTWSLDMSMHNGSGEEGNSTTDFVDQLADPCSEQKRKDDFDTLVDMFHKLTYDYKKKEEVLMAFLYSYVGYKHKEIAKILGTSESSVSLKVGKVKNHMRNKMLNRETDVPEIQESTIRKSNDGFMKQKQREYSRRYYLKNKERILKKQRMTYKKKVS